jgi:hypothetical protein
MPPKARTFKTPDGQEFTDRSEWRKYMMDTFYSFKNKKGSPFPDAKMPGTIDGQMFVIEDCEDTELVVMDHCEQVQIDNVKNSKIFIGACESSIFIRNCENCTFYVACRQLRLREVVNSTFYSFSTAEVHIEYSNTCKFAPFNGGYPDQSAHFKVAKLPLDHNLWYDIFDHNDPEKTGSNWSLLPESAYQEWFPMGACERCIPLTKPGTVVRVDDDTTGGGNMQSFSLQTSAADAQAAVEKIEEENIVEEDTPIQEVTVSKEQAEDVAAGLSIADCIQNFGTYIPGVTNLFDLCTPDCEIVLDNGAPATMDEFKGNAKPTQWQETEKIFESADGSLAWGTFWCTNAITNELFVTSCVLVKEANGGYKMCHLHRGTGVKEEDFDV